MFGRGRFANRPYNGLIRHAFSFQLRNTKSACCVPEQVDEHPRGWGKGVCNTPLHFITQYADFVLPPPKRAYAVCDQIASKNRLILLKQRVLQLFGLILEGVVELLCACVKQGEQALACMLVVGERL